MLVKPSSRLWLDASNNPICLIGRVYSLIEAGGTARSDPNFLVSEKREAVHSLVCDIRNELYDWPTAHFPQDIDVILVEAYRSRLRATLAGTPHRNAVNVRVAVHHNSNGTKQRPPYFEDHTHDPHPAYGDVRDLTMLAATIAGKFVKE